MDVSGTQRILGRIACITQMRPIAADVARSVVCASFVCLHVRITDEMQFGGGQTGAGRKNHVVLDGVS